MGLCGADGWFLGVKATDGPLGPSATCNPIGAWDLTYGPVEKTEGYTFCTKPGEPDLEVKASASGALIANFAGGTVTIGPDGCAVAASVTTKYTNPSEYWSATAAVTLTLSGDQGTGTYEKSNSGFCYIKTFGTVTAKRQ